jgi:hypothetical protein
MNKNIRIEMSRSDICRKTKKADAIAIIPPRANA